MDSGIASPFVKWAGGKRGIISQIALLFPKNIGTYYEPFVGGGAVFFAFADRIDRAFLSDANEELMIAYQVVKENVDDLLKILKQHAMNHCKDYFMKIRKKELRDGIQIAARFIYLNKTCYNGLYRVNKHGKFNVPIGQYKNPTICDEKRLRSASLVLQKATIKLGDFSKTTKAGNGDFVYVDPPYDECFSSYQAEGFSDKEQERLRVTADKWIALGASVMLSNSSTPLIRRIYRGKKYRLTEIKAPRHISCKGSDREKASELIITSC